jgi:hypothetical protein
VNVLFVCAFCEFAHCQRTCEENQKYAPILHLSSGPEKRNSRAKQIVPAYFQMTSFRALSRLG